MSDAWLSPGERRGGLWSRLYLGTHPSPGCPSGELAFPEPRLAHLYSGNQHGACFPGRPSEVRSPAGRCLPRVSLRMGWHHPGLGGTTAAEPSGGPGGKWCPGLLWTSLHSHGSPLHRLGKPLHLPASIRENLLSSGFASSRLAPCLPQEPLKAGSGKPALD